MYYVFKGIAIIIMIIALYFQVERNNFKVTVGLLWLVITCNSVTSILYMLAKN